MPKSIEREWKTVGELGLIGLGVMVTAQKEHTAPMLCLRLLWWGHREFIWDTRRGSPSIKWEMMQNKRRGLFSSLRS